MLAKDSGCGLADDPQVVKAVKFFPEGVQWALLVIPQSLTDLLNRFQKQRDGKQSDFPAPRARAGQGRLTTEKKPRAPGSVET
jgi:hypothetical protein